MKQFYKIVAIVSLLASAVACDTPLPGVSPTSDKELKISAVPASDFTKATDTAFEIGDALSVFGFDPETVTTWLNNAKFTKNDSGFASDQTHYWYEGESVSLLLGIYPYNSDFSGEALLGGSIESCVKSDQSTHANYTASDFMVAIAESAPTSECVTLPFYHLLSKLVIDINNQTNATIKDVYIDGVTGGITFNMANYGVNTYGNAGTIKAGELATATQGYTNSYVMIIPPQEVAPKLVITTTDNKQYTYNAPEAINFGSGKVRHLTTTITEQSISTEFDAIVNDWSADENIEFKDQEGGDNEDPNQPEIPSNITPIADILSLGIGSTIQSATIEGVVISNMELDNLTSLKTLYIQDPTAGLQFYLAENHSFAFGDKVQIDLSGATLGTHNSAIQISGITLNKITKLSSGNIVEPKLVTIEEFLLNKYESQYIAIEGVQVVEADLGKSWVMDGAHTSITMEDAQGNSFVVFSSKYATYGKQTVAQGSGLLKGIAGFNNEKVQIIFTQESDFAGLTGERFGAEQGGNEGPSGGMQINPLWNVEYVAEYTNPDDGNTYRNLIHVVSTDENNGFFLEFISEEFYNQNVKPDLYAYVKNGADSLVENLKNYNAENGTNWDFTAYTNYHWGLYDVHWIMNPGRWVACMWGMTTEGEVTSQYYVSDVIEIIDPATPEYKAWIGTYTLEDSNELTSEITISQNVVNESFWIDGWNGVYGDPIYVPYDPEGSSYEFGGGRLFLNSQIIASDFDIVDGTHVDYLYFGGLLDNNLFLGDGYGLGEIQWFAGEDVAMIYPYSYQMTDGTTVNVAAAGYFLEMAGHLYLGTGEVHSLPGYLLRKISGDTRTAVARKSNPLEYGNNGIAKSLDEVKREKQPQLDNYVVGGRKFNAVNF